VLPQFQVVREVGFRLEQPDAGLSLPALVQVNLSQRLGLSFLRRGVDGRARLKICPNVGRQETRGYGRNDHCDPASLQFGQRNGGLPAGAFFDGADGGSRQGQVAAKQGDVFGQIKVRVDDRERGQAGFQGPRA